MINVNVSLMNQSNRNFDLRNHDLTTLYSNIRHLHYHLIQAAKNLLVSIFQKIKKAYISAYSRLWGLWRARLSRGSSQAWGSWWALNILLFWNYSLFVAHVSSKVYEARKAFIIANKKCLLNKQKFLPGGPGGPFGPKYE